MLRRPFGPTGVQVPVLGQGTWAMEQDDRAGAIAALRAGIDLGMTHIDTAELYGAGVVETLVGEAIAGRRDEVFLVSKVLPSNAWSGEIVHACEESLRRLRTDWLDCYLVHWPVRHPLEDTIEGFEELLREGKIRSYGVSNFPVAELEEAVKLAGPGRIACDQVLYHLGQREIEREVLPWCEQHGIAVVGFSPLGSGRFPVADSPDGRALGKIAAAHRVTPRQVALAFLLREHDIFLIPKSAHVEHTRENAAALDLVLTDENLQRLARAFPRPRRSHRGVPTL